MLNLKRGQTAAGRRKEKRREKIPRIFLVPQHRRLGQHSKHQQSSKSLSFRVWLSCTLISYAHTINIVCHHLITRESVRNAYGRSRNPISHSCILSLPRTTYLKKRLDFHYDQNRVVTERISTYWKDFTHAWFDALWSVRRSYRLSFPLYFDLGAFNLASLKINKNKTDSGPFPVENHSLAKTLISHYPVMLISDPGNTSVCLAIIGSVVIVIMIIMPSS